MNTLILGTTNETPNLEDHRTLDDAELDAVTGGLVVNSIIGILIGQLNPKIEPAEKHWFNGG